MATYKIRLWTFILFFYLVGIQFLRWFKEGRKNKNLIEIVSGHENIACFGRIVQSTGETTTISYTGEQLREINFSMSVNKLYKRINHDVVKNIRKLRINKKRKRGSKGGKRTKKFQIKNLSQLGINWDNITKVGLQKSRNTSKFDEELKLSMVNVCSNKNKQFRIRQLIDEDNVDLMLLTETWLMNEDKEWINCCELNKNGYSIQCVNRSENKTRGGGLALIYKDGAVVKYLPGVKDHQFESGIWEFK